jgi:hypothetical protein
MDFRNGIKTERGKNGRAKNEKTIHKIQNLNSCFPLGTGSFLLLAIADVECIEAETIEKLIFSS